MNSSQLYIEIEKLSQLIKRWSDHNAPSAIERDIALNKLRLMYESILCLDTPSCNEENSSVADVDSKEEPVVSQQSREEVIETSSVAQTEYVEEEKPQEDKAQIVADTLRKLSINPQSSSENKGKIRSMLEAALDEIFDGEEKCENQAVSTPKEVEEVVKEEVIISSDQYTIPEKKVENRPNVGKEQISIEIIDVSERTKVVEEEFVAPQYTKQVLGDTMSTTTIADQFVNSSTTHFVSEQISDKSLESLGINERYFIARELFNEDTQLCNDMLCRLDSFENYDDCMIYIAENYSWRSDSEAARYVLELINNKFNIN